MLISMLQGLSMSLADSVPGVSEAQYAFILGFREVFGSTSRSYRPRSQSEKICFFVSSQVFGRLGRRHDTCVMILSKAFENISTF